MMKARIIAKSVGTKKFNNTLSSTFHCCETKINDIYSLELRLTTISKRPFQSEVLEISSIVIFMNHLPNELLAYLLEFVPVTSWSSLMRLNKAHYQRIKPLVDDYLFERDQRVFNHFWLLSSWPVFRSKLKSLTTRFTFDPSGNYNDFLSWACSANELDLVKNLLADPRVIAKAPYNTRISMVYDACVNGHVGVLHELFYGPNALYNDKASLMYATTHACRSGQIQVVRMFLADPRVDICASTNGDCPLCATCWQGRTEIVRLLLSDKTRRRLRITCARAAIGFARDFQHLDIVQMMLFDQRVIAELSERTIIAYSAWCQQRC